MIANYKFQKLIDIAEIFIDGDWIEKKNQSESGIILIQTGNIGLVKYKDKENKRYINEQTFKNLSCKEVFPGDILISRLPDPVGRACIVPDLKSKLITAVDCTIFRPKKDYYSKYLNYLLNSNKSLLQVSRFLTGSSRKRISRRNLEKIQLPIPHKNGKSDLNEQKRIAYKIDKLFKEIDKAIEQIEKQLGQFETVKRSILNQAFQGKL